MNDKLSALVLVGLSLTTGCAMTRETVPLHTYTVANISRVAHPNQTRPVTVARVVDKRNISDPAYLFHKFNTYGPTTGSFVAQRPIADIVKDCLLDAMNRAGYLINDEADRLSIICEIQDLDIESKTGMWSHEISSELALKLTIMQDGDDRVLWRDTIIGRGRTPRGGFTYGRDTAKCFSLALDDATRQFVENERRCCG
jgi:hypothetical protein